MENGSIIFNDNINKAINNKIFTDHFDQDPLSILKVAYIEDEKLWNLSKYQFGDEFLYVSNDHGNIKKDRENFFRINAKDVSILKNKETSHSSLNQFSCIITNIEEFMNSSNVLITIVTKDKQILKSYITRKSVTKLNLKINDEVQALIKTVSIF
jgi:molybdopterin-binding protein